MKASEAPSVVLDYRTLVATVLALRSNHLAHAAISCGRAFPPEPTNGGTKRQISSTSSRANQAECVAFLAATASVPTEPVAVLPP